MNKGAYIDFNVLQDNKVMISMYVGDDNMEHLKLYKKYPYPIEYTFTVNEKDTGKKIIINDDDEAKKVFKHYENQLWLLEKVLELNPH
jgi:hypothetical protein